MRPADYEVIDARPRVVSPMVADLQPRQRLADLEHVRMRDTMLAQLRATSTGNAGGRSRAPAGAVRTSLNASTWWQQSPQDALLTAVLPQQQPFRKEPFPRDVTLALLPDDDGENALVHQVIEGDRRGKDVYAEVNRSQCEHLRDDAVAGRGIEPWGVTDYLTTLNELAGELEMSPMDCARPFGTVTVRLNDNRVGQSQARRCRLPPAGAVVSHVAGPPHLPGVMNWRMHSSKS